MIKRIKKLRNLLRQQGKPASLFAGMPAFNIKSVPGIEKGIFITGVGRSGTHFMAELFSQSTTVRSYHMDDIGDAVGDSFTWYCKWYRLPVSSEDFIQSRRYLIQQASSDQKTYLESNPMIAFSIDDLASTCDARFVIMVRNPKHVVESHLHKGWYTHVPAVATEEAPGYQYYLDRPNHSFSRIMPAARDERQRWLQYTRHGKIAWMWRVTYERVFAQLRALSPDHYRIVVLDDFDYTQYQTLAAFLRTAPISESAFQAVTSKKPGKGVPKEKVTWNNQSKEEFNREVMLTVQAFESFGFQRKWLLE